jgi:hypothetical protein
LGRVAFVVEEDKAFDPLQIGLFGTQAEVPGADEITDLIEQFFV